MTKHVSYAPLTRVLIAQLDLGRTLRWRKLRQQRSRRPREVRLMREDLLQHCGSMAFIGMIMRREALALGDTSHSNIDWDKFIVMSMLHDVDEVLIGDARSKDTAYYQAEQQASEELWEWVRKHLLSASYFEDVMGEYHERKTATARYTKVKDELQAWLYMIHTRGFAETTRDFTDLSSIEGYRLSEPFDTTRGVMDFAGRIIRRPSYIKAKIRQMPFDE